MTGNPNKVQTGIAGFDEVTSGGLPQGRTTLLLGGAGSGKTIFALQYIAEGIRSQHHPAIFVAFEERAERIASNAASFRWNVAELSKKKLFFLDAQPRPDLIQLGDFNIDGLLEALDYQIKAMGAKRIVFDALDVVLALLPDAATRQREVYRLHEWLLERHVTSLITAKIDDFAARNQRNAQNSFGFMQFMVDCAVILNHDVSHGISQRTIRVLKYRGSSFDENESPFMINKSGIEVGFARPVGRHDIRVSNERVSSGVRQLDNLLEGGYYRHSCVLIAGEPGSGKSTLAAACAEAACKRGERALLVSFDTDGSEVVRNLSTVGITLGRYVRNGALLMKSARSIIGSAGAHFVRIKTLAEEHRANFVIIDPVSTLSRALDDTISHSVTELLIDWAKSEGITLICTTLGSEPLLARIKGASFSHLATLSDTLIQLEQEVRDGERVRHLSIVKSRGTAHSNKIHNFVLCAQGFVLDVSTRTNASRSSDGFRRASASEPRATRLRNK